ncbi:MAG: thiamine-phosphate kinase [Dehalococcoidia bacterium]|nr:thiamine-phosphate kinase [Dehalococcoidia bacterium]
MKVNEISEFELIRLLSKTLSDNYKTSGMNTIYNEVVGLGDDAAVWDVPEGRQVFTTDALVNNVHFNLRFISPIDLGWKSMVASQSDIAAMGFKPLFATVSLGLSGEENLGMLTDLYKGLADAASQFGGKVVGGDTVKSETLFISISMLGYDPSNKSQTNPLKRHSAKPGEVVAVTGSLGSSAGGLRILQDKTGTLPRCQDLIESHTRPRPQIDTGVWLARHGIKCAADISDGLLADLGHICEASKVGADIKINTLPVTSDLKSVFPTDWEELSLTGGEDYQLVFTGTKRSIDEAISSLETPISIIGQITDNYPEINVLNSKGVTGRYTSSGFDHFKNK